MTQPTRREFMATSAALAAAGSAAWGVGAPAVKGAAALDHHKPLEGRIYKTLKWGMVQLEGSTVEKFRQLRELGYDGVELDSPGGLDKKEAREAVEETGFPVDGTVDSTHWHIRLTEADESRREKGLQDLLTAIRETHFVHGNTVLLVPGHGKDGPKDVIRQRAVEQIRKALPLAAKLGIYIAIENVWNSMFYEHDGPEGQSADELVSFIDEIDSPWVGVQFDIGNHQKYSKPADWIRALGRRIVKLDVKDWGKQAGWAKIGEGDVDWADVRKALIEINFSGWAAAEVGGGGADRLKEVSTNMDKVFAL